MTKLQISILAVVGGVSSGLYACLSHGLFGGWNIVLAGEFGVIVALAVSGMQAFRPSETRAR